MKISVIIPMYNESRIVADTVRTLDAALLDDFGQGEYEMIFSNDGSTDNTGEIAMSLAEKYPAMRVVGNDENFGKGHAVRV